LSTPLLVVVVAVSAAVSLAVSLTIVLLFGRPKAGLAEASPWSAVKKRVRKRYVVFEVVTSSEVSEEDVRAAIEDSFKRLFGEVGYAGAEPKLIFYDKVARRGIVRVRSTGLQNLMAALSVIRKVGSAEAMVVPLRTSGTIRKARKYIYQ